MRSRAAYLPALLVLCAGCCQCPRVGVWTERHKCVRVIDGLIPEPFLKQLALLKSI